MSDGTLFNLDPVATGPGSGTVASTQSLYRKHRPTSFADDDLVGQEHVVHTLRNAIALNRISHAYLFCGPRGTGKTTTARLMAKAVNCLADDPHLRPCNDCASCNAINANATTDVIEIDAASNRGIDDIRDLRERVKYAPTQLRTKFYIIDEAHQITGAAANAFLKTLEEPPPHTRFILATTDPEELLPTIVSRCQRFDFRRISLEASVARLRTVADRESISIEDDALPVIARQATGSLRDALGMLDQLAVYRSSGNATDGPITADLAREVLGVSRNERIETLAASLANRDAASGLKEIEAAVDAGDDIRQLGRQFVAYLRQLMLVKVGGAPDADARSRELAESFDLARLASIVRSLADIDFRTRRATLPHLPLELAIVEGAQQGGGTTARTNTPDELEAPTRPRQSAPPDDVPPVWDEEPAPQPKTTLRDRVRGTSAPRPAQRAPEQPRRIAEPAPSPSEPKPTQAPPVDVPRAVPAKPGDLDLEYLVDLWPRIRADVKAVNRRIEALLQQVDPGAITDNKVILVSPYEFHRNRINTDEVRNTIESVISRLVGKQIVVSCMARENLPRTSSPRKTTTAPQSMATEPQDPAAADEPVTGEPVDTVVPSPEDEDSTRRRIVAAQNIFDADEIQEP